MDYRLELLDEDTFEKLVNRICQKVLGIGVISFAKGKDGGRDGKFEGKANSYPSNTEQWEGKFIIQAKHTANPTATCNDYDFKSKIIDAEIKKIKELKKEGEIDCYLLFTNRRYSGVSGEKILKEMRTDTGVDKLVIIGKESINDLYINPYKDIVSEFQLNKHHIPFDFSEADIKDIISSFRAQLTTDIEKEISNRVEDLKYDFNKISLEEKNLKNKLGEEYYNDVILSSSLEYFSKIEKFLEDPRNEEIKEVYYDIASELNNIITIKRGDFGAFEEIFAYIYDKICAGEKIIGKRYIFILLHFMYHECLIGKK